MRTIGVLLALTVALSAQEPQQPPAELAIRVIVPEPDSYVSGITKLKAEILPKMLATRVGQILFFATASRSATCSIRSRRNANGTPAPKCARTCSASSAT